MEDRDRLRDVAVLLVTVGIFGTIVQIVDIGEIVDILTAADVVFLTGSILLLGIIFPVKAYRWKIVLELFDHYMSLRRCLAVELATYPLVSITPSRSGELVKIFYVRDRIPAIDTVASVVYSRVLDAALLAIFGGVGIVGFVLNYPLPNVIFVVVTCIVVAGVGLQIVRMGYLSGILERLGLTGDHVAVACNRPDVFGIAVCCSVVLFVLSLFQTVLFFYALGLSPPTLYAITRIPAAILVGLLPITLAGIGTRDAAFIFLFSQYGTPESLLAIGIIFTTVRYWLPSVVGLPVFLSEGRR